MKKIVFCAFTLGIVAQTTFAQTFFPLPGALLEQEVGFSLANECYIHFDDNSADSLHLKWRLAEASIPDGWDIDLCDYGTCYTGIPSGKTMLSAPDSIQPYLKLLVQPGTIAGNAWIWFRVSEVNNEQNYQDVYFSLFTPGTTGTVEPSTSQFRIWPNPATDWLFIQTTQPAGTLRITDVNGKLFWENKSAFSQQILVSQWPTGIYYIFDNQTIKSFIKN
jgi:hypothetical protein